MSGAGISSSPRLGQKVAAKICAVGVPKPESAESMIGPRSIAMEIAWRTCGLVNGSRVRLKPIMRICWIELPESLMLSSPSRMEMSCEGAYSTKSTVP